MRTPSARATLGLLLLLGTVPIVAQTVYKCVDKTGNPVFSTEPCGKDAKATTYSNAPKKDPADYVKRAREQQEATGQVAPSSPKVETNAGVQGIADSVADTDCRRSANGLFASDAASRIEGMQAHISDLQHSRWTGGSAAQRQNMERMDEQEILTLRQSISMEQMRVDESRKRVDDALASCNKKREERDKARMGSVP